MSSGENLGRMYKNSIKSQILKSYINLSVDRALKFRLDIQNIWFLSKHLYSL